MLTIELRGRSHSAGAAKTLNRVRRSIGEIAIARGPVQQNEDGVTLALSPGHTGIRRSEIGARVASRAARKCLIDDPGGTWRVVRSVSRSGRARSQCLPSVRGIGFVTRCCPDRASPRYGSKEVRALHRPESGVPTAGPNDDHGGNKMTVMIGVDPHKRSHTAVAIDDREDEMARDRGASDRATG